MPQGRGELYHAIDAGPIQDDDGKLIAVVETLRDMTAQKRAETALKSLAASDGLTGLANRRCLARYGGEEFAVILPETDCKGALKIAERLRCGLAELQLPHGAAIGTAYVTISFGVGDGSPSGLSLFGPTSETSDPALYAAKRSGRNREIIADGRTAVFGTFGIERAASAV